MTELNCNAEVSFADAFEASLSAHIGNVPEGTGFLTHASSWEVWERGQLVNRTDNEEEADQMFDSYVKKWH